MTPPIGSTREGRTSLPAESNTALAPWVSAGSSVHVIPIRHPVIETLGHRPTSGYGEQFWLPVLGPTSLWIYRRLATRFAEEPLGFRQDLSILGREVGIGTGTGRNAPVAKALKRLVDFHLAEIIGDTLGVYTSLPPLNRRQVARLPEHLASRHEAVAHRSIGGNGRPPRGHVAEAGR